MNQKLVQKRDQHMDRHIDQQKDQQTKETIMKEAILMTSAARATDVPASGLLEIALVGRSNVGKSSFINMLAMRHALARTSNTPGKTRLINFYCLDPKEMDPFVLIDLPGYGYASVSQSMRRDFLKMIESTLLKRPSVKLVFLLVDARHAPSQEDLNVEAYLRAYAIPYRIIATKQDKLKRQEINKHLSIIRTAFKLPDISSELGPHLVSAKTRYGREHVFELIRLASSTFARGGRGSSFEEQKDADDDQKERPKG